MKKREGDERRHRLQKRQREGGGRERGKEAEGRTNTDPRVTCDRQLSGIHNHRSFGSTIKSWLKYFMEIIIAKWYAPLPF
jgi:hypothetical protein